ncbi:hypothetical protein AVEN_244997-1 [Araneus ventricosus]|uniref:Uncharacterized protein n=1 Tax=Araneus ventricosus TaxID=182803 RepID=A0A4Y2NG18_ARAVE|nr:hypothetical protein AVEN_244997-1 [Araneus ventricosus]
MRRTTSELARRSPNFLITNAGRPLPLNVRFSLRQAHKHDGSSVKSGSNLEHSDLETLPPGNWVCGFYTKILDFFQNLYRLTINGWSVSQLAREM